MINFGQKSEHDISNRKYREATWNGKYGDRSHKLGNAVAFLVAIKFCRKFLRVAKMAKFEICATFAIDAKMENFFS